QESVRGNAAGHHDLARRSLFQGPVKLFQERFHDRLLEGGRQVRTVLLGQRFAEVAEPVEQRRLEAAEAVFEAGQGRLRQLLPPRIAPPREAVEGRSARETQAEHPRRLVESLAGRVVAGPADDLETTVAWHPHQ